MTNEELDTIEQRLRAATQGPWEADYTIRRRGGIFWKIRNMEGQFVVEEPYSRMTKADAELIAAAPSDIAALIAEVRRLQDALSDCEGERDSAQWAAMGEDL